MISETHFSYYGNLEGIKPRKPWTESMLDEFLKNKCEEAVVHFNKELKVQFNEVKASFRSDLFTLKRDVRQLQSKIKSMEKKANEKESGKPKSRKKQSLSDIRESIAMDQANAGSKGK